MTTTDKRAHDDLKAIAGGAGLSLVGRVVNGALILLYGIVLARLLDVHSVGIVMLGLAIIRLIEIVARMGLELGALHYVAILNGSNRAGSIRVTVRRVMRLVLILSFALAGILAVGAPVFARMFDLPELAPVLRILAWSLPPTSASMILLATLLALRQVGYNTIGEKVVLPATNLIGCIVLVAAGMGVAGASAAYVIAALVTLPLLAHYYRRCTPPAKHPAVPVPSLDLLRFSAPVFLVVIFNQLLTWTDTFMLGLLRDATQVGIYSAAVRMATATSLIVGSFNAIFAPTISDLYHRNDLKRLEYLFKTVGKWTFLATLPLVACALLLATELMQLFGTAFVAGSGSLMILALTHLTGASAASVGFMLTMSGRQNLMLLNTAVAFALNVALNLALIPPFGMNGAAAATLAAFAVSSLLSLVQVRRMLGMHPYTMGYLKVLAAGAAPFALVSLAKMQLGALPYLYAIPVYGLAYAVLYVGALFLLGFTKEDELIFATIKRRFGRGA